jgi:hypothetical protein
LQNIQLSQQNWYNYAVDYDNDRNGAKVKYGDSLNLTMSNYSDKTFVGNIDSHAIAEGASVFGGEGGGNLASGVDSIAGGTSSTASGDSAISLGNGCKASGKYAVALGRQTDAKAQSAIAIGQKSVATAWGAFAGGAEETLSAGTASFAFGKGVKDHPVEASGEASLAIGETYTDGSTYYPVKATGKAAVALGLGASSSGEATLAVGYRTAASNLQAVALGSVTEASGKYAVALGRNTKATAQSATAIGQSSTASGWGSLAGGTEECVASKKGAVALGGHAKAEGDFAVALGDHVTAKQNNQIVLGKYNTENSTSIVIVGNGSSSTPKNVFTIAADGVPSVATDGVTIGYLTSNYYTKAEINAMDIGGGGTGSATEETVKLAQDLYTYTSIGKITGASNTNPILVAEKGKKLKDVFNKVFGEQTDTQPTISTNGVSLSVSAGTTSYGGGEYGTAVAATDVTITFTLNNSATAQYGYRCGTTKTETTNATFKYAITKQSGADIKITLPTGKTASKDMLMDQTLFVSAEGNVLYCNLNSSNKVSIKIHLDAGSVTTSSQTRYGQIKGEVSLGAAQTTAGTTIDRFLTFLKNDATDTSKLSGGSKYNTAGSYTISAGSYYSYSKLTNSTTAPTSGATKQDNTNCDNTYTYANGQYLWLLSKSSGKKIQTYVAGSWADVNTSGGTAITLTLASGGTATYYAYRTDKFTANGSARYRLA